LPLHKDFIRKSVSKAIKEYVSTDSVSVEELEKILTAAIYNVLDSRDFERHIKEITK
jgi:hypothetical protein